jgi:hypothetical protein
MAATAELPAIGMAWLTEHVGASVAAEGPATAQLRVTMPVNPLAGVIMMFEVAVVPDATGVIALAFSENVPPGCIAWNGSQPLKSSPIYGAPIMVKGTALTIKAFASAPGKKDSPVVTGIFRIAE